MEEDEYIDLDKINVTPNGKDMPGFSKEQKDQKSIKDESPKKEDTAKKEIKQEKKAVVSKTKKKTTKKVTTTTKQEKKAVVSKTKKKTTKSKKAKKAPNKTNNKLLIYLLLGIVLLAIIILAITKFYEPKESNTEQKVVALVNGEPLNNEEVETRGTWLELVNGISATDEQILNLSIDIELLYQEAKKQNMTISEEDIDEIFDQMASGLMTQDELKDYLKTMGIKPEVLRELIKKEVLASELIAQETQPIIAEDEKKQYYENNKYLFVHDQLAKVKHIQISFTNKTDQETYDEALNIKEQINDDKTNFCELVKNNTYDLNTRNTCGEYVFEAQDEYPDEFLKKSFELKDGKVDIVKTEAGYHILWKVETMPAGISSFEDIKELIELQLKQEKSEQLYLNLLKDLRASATIEYYQVQEQQNNQEKEDEVTDLTNDAQQDNVNDEQQDAQQDNVNDEQQDLNDAESSNENAEVTKDKNITITYEEATNPESDDTRKLKLAQCLTNKGVKMYNVYWSPDGKEQKEAFSVGAEHLKTIECDADGTNPKVAECKNVLQKEYPTWPTWQINGELYEGYQNLNKLATLAGCEY